MSPDDGEALRWAAFAEEDYQYALLGMREYPRNASWDFHQAAEKYLKAILKSRGTEPPRTHDLLLLLTLLVPELSPDDELVEAASGLALFGVIRRYPADLPEVGQEDARRARTLAEHIRGFARRELGLEPP